MCYGPSIYWVTLTLRKRNFSLVLPLCPRPLDYSGLAVTSHWSKLSIMMFIVEHTDDSMASGGKGGRCWGGIPPPLPFFSSPSPHSSSRLIWCLVGTTPATEPNRDNHFPMDFPWELHEEGGLFDICLDAPEGRRWLKKGDHEPYKVEMTKSRCWFSDFCIRDI